MDDHNIVKQNHSGMLTMDADVSFLRAVRPTSDLKRGMLGYSIAVQQISVYARKGLRVARYRCIRRLGGGSFGDVYELTTCRRGFPPALALKLIADEAAAEVEAVGLTAGASSTVAAAVVWQKGDMAAIAMELAVCTLSRFCARQRPDALGALRITLEVAKALHALHRETDVIYWDLKGANVLMMEGGGRVPRLGDLGSCARPGKPVRPTMPPWWWRGPELDGDTITNSEAVAVLQLVPLCLEIYMGFQHPLAYTDKPDYALYYSTLELPREVAKFVAAVRGLEQAGTLTYGHIVRALETDLI